MRHAIFEWVSTYPPEPGYRDGSFKGAGVGETVRKTVPAALRTLIHERDRYEIKGSIGQSDWADAPWVAVMDKSVTTTTQEGFYLVYLLSHGCDRLYLTLGQGCTRLKEEAGIAAASDTLKQRAHTMWRRCEADASRLGPLAVDLNAPRKNWRARLYEDSIILGRAYDTHALPNEDIMITDFREALSLYRHLTREGGWSSDDEIALEAEEDGIQGKLSYLKAYRLHKRAERSSKHSREVKKRHTPECAACGFTTKGRYDVANVEAVDILEAHHLVPLHTLADGEIARFDIMKDFALLCPNCHRMIHRLGAEDLAGLRKIVRRS